MTVTVTGGGSASVAVTATLFSFFTVPLPSPPFPCLPLPLPPPFPFLSPHFPVLSSSCKCVTDPLSAPPSLPSGLCSVPQLLPTPSLSSTGSGAEQRRAENRYTPRDCITYPFPSPGQRACLVPPLSPARLLTLPLVRSLLSSCGAGSAHWAPLAPREQCREQGAAEPAPSRLQHPPLGWPARSLAGSPG